MFRGVQIIGAVLQGASLRGAEFLEYGSLKYAVLISANFFRADRRGADLTRANLTGAQLSWALAFWLSWCDQAGVKKCSHFLTPAFQFSSKQFCSGYEISILPTAAACCVQLERFPRGHGTAE
ncbi:pentapeptide repeat-containing protein [Gloeobacter morelensis]|uniref:Pentapeptide repeat-containing protein n=1 Tax=Gloeobacter morelensis MG652769 TaxID=2781736 RepID=A0ABY3PGC7_9CYAN|nr:pentapeptide repeat-containing protein [Gloeobacter morelensis MG652769]